MIYKNVCYAKGNIYYKNKGDLKYNKTKYVRKYFVKDPNGKYELLKTGEQVKLTESEDFNTVKMLGDNDKAFLYDLKPVEQFLLYTYLDDDRYITDEDYRIAHFDIEIQSGRKYPLQHKIHIKGQYLSILEFETKDNYMNIPVYDEEDKTVKPYRRSCYYKAEFPYANKAEYPINLITVYSNIDKKYHSFGLLHYDRTREDGHDPLVTDYREFEDEATMLKSFGIWFNKQNFDILTGWNSSHFDVPYVINRMEILEPDSSIIMSPLGIKPVIDNDNTISNVNYDYSYNCDIPGLIHIDYMVMYRHLTRQFNLPSFKLDDICEKELKDKKIEYEGPIREFYRNNPNMYINYNHKDVDLFVRLDQKLHLINTAISLSHNGLIIVNKISSMAKLAEAYILQFMLKNNKVPLNKEKNPRDWWIEEGYYRNVLEDGTVEWQNLIPNTRVEPSKLGRNRIKIDERIKKDSLIYVQEKKAYYSYPLFSVKAGYCANKSGLYKHCLDGDINSSYPHHIRQYNISPECLVIKPSKEEIETRHLIKSKVNGVYFTSEEGMIPKFVKNVYVERSKFKKLMNQAEADGNEVLRMRYFVEQRTRKTIINSVYGALLYPKFRFYAIDCARAITRGARCTIRDIISETDKLYLGDGIFEKANKYLPTIKLTFDNGKTDYYYPDDVIEIDGVKKKAIELL